MDLWCRSVPDENIVVRPSAGAHQLPHQRPTQAGFCYAGKSTHEERKDESQWPHARRQQHCQETKETEKQDSLAFRSILRSWRLRHLGTEPNVCWPILWPTLLTEVLKCRWTHSHLLQGLSVVVYSGGMHQMTALSTTCSLGAQMLEVGAGFVALPTKGLLFRWSAMEAEGLLDFLVQQRQVAYTNHIVNMRTSDYAPSLSLGTARLHKNKCHQPMIWTEVKTLHYAMAKELYKDTEIMRLGVCGSKQLASVHYGAQERCPCAPKAMLS